MDVPVLIEEKKVKLDLKRRTTLKMQYEDISPSVKMLKCLDSFTDTSNQNSELES